MEVNYSITLHPLVISKDIPRLDPRWRQEIRDSIRIKLGTRPELFGKPLQEDLRGLRRLRVGDYRVVFQIQKRTVHIIAIRHRSDGYKGIEKRI